MNAWITIKGEFRNNHLGSQKERELNIKKFGGHTIKIGFQNVEQIDELMDHLLDERNKLTNEQKVER